MSKIISVFIAIVSFISFSAQAAPEAISGIITLSPKLVGKVSPNDIVYVLARATQGPRMPIAVIRKQVKDLPIQFVLDDSMAMRPQVKISDFNQVKVAARISKSGSAITQPGDYEGVSAAIKPGTTGLNIVIDTEIVSSSKRSLSL